MWDLTARRLGLHVFLRQSSLHQDLSRLLQVITRDGVSTQRLMLTSDCSAPAFYQEMGITDHILTKALNEGVNPVQAYQMVTINPAVYFGMDGQVGGIAPGRDADILILEDLFHPKPGTVISKGRIIAQDGRLCEPFPRLDWPRFFPPGSFVQNRWSATPEMFHIKSRKKRLRFPVINLIRPVITRVVWRECEMKDGVPDLHPRKGCSLIALLDKEGGWVTNGIIQGFGEGVEGLAAPVVASAPASAVHSNQKWKRAFE